jgi:hypothetical protein
LRYFSAAEQRKLTLKQLLKLPAKSKVQAIGHATAAAGRN